MKKILFVCLGNICRSPAAEAIFSALLEKGGLREDFSCDSAGTSSFSATNSPSDAQMTASAKKRGIKLTHYSRRICAADFDEFDYIIGMDDSNIRNIEKLREKTAVGKAKVLKMAVFLPEGKDCVPDPYGGENTLFEHVLDLLETGTANLLEFLKKQEEK